MLRRLYPQKFDYQGEHANRELIALGLENAERTIWRRVEARQSGLLLCSCSAAGSMKTYSIRGRRKRWPAPLRKRNALTVFIAWRRLSRSVSCRRSSLHYAMSSKNKKKVQQTQTTVCANTNSVSSGPTCTPKHWFGVKVKDDQGNPVTDAKVHLKLNDGSNLDPGVGVDGVDKTAAILDAATPCTVTFPALCDCERWPDGSSAPAATEAGNAMTTVDGDCTLTLAAKNGYRDYHTIWDQSQNNTLKATRPNPNVLLTGDMLNGPSLKTKTVDKPVDAYATFVVKSRRPAKLRMVLVDKDLNPLNGWVWTLLTPIAANGTTGADGLIEFDGIDPTKTIGTMKVTINKR